MGQPCYSSDLQTSPIHRKHLILQPEPDSCPRSPDRRRLVSELSLTHLLVLEHLYKSSPGASVRRPVLRLITDELRYTLGNWVEGCLEGLLPAPLILTHTPLWCRYSPPHPRLLLLRLVFKVSKVFLGTKPL